MECSMEKKISNNFRWSETNCIADDVDFRISTKCVLGNKTGSYIYAKDKWWSKTILL